MSGVYNGLCLLEVDTHSGFGISKRYLLVNNGILGTVFNHSSTIETIHTHHCDYSAVQLENLPVSLATSRVAAASRMAVAACLHLLLLVAVMA